MKYKLLIKKQPEDYDADRIRFEKAGNITGFGYIGKVDNRIHIMSCPACLAENYALQIDEGSCYNCGFDPNDPSQVELTEGLRV